jgi:hypothetical protein
VLEGKAAVNIFYSEISQRLKVEEHFPLIEELYRIFSGKYDISGFVPRILTITED